MHQTINFIDYFVMRRHYVDDIMLTSNDKYLIPMVNFDLKNTFDMEDLEKWWSLIGKDIGIGNLWSNCIIRN
mgnify:CR=1 FL=1